MNPKNNNPTYTYAKKAIELIYENHKLNKKAKNEIYIYELAQKLKNITKPYLLNSKQNKQYAHIKQIDKPMSILEYCFETIAHALLKAKRSQKYIVDVQFNLIDSFLYASWALLKPKVALKIFQLIQHNFKFPEINIKTQYEVCCKLAEKIYTQQQETSFLSQTLKDIYERFLNHANEINQWKALAAAKHNEKIIKQFELKLYEWNLIKYIMTLYVIVYGYQQGDTVFKQLIYRLLKNCDKSNLALDAINYLLATKHIIRSLNDHSLNQMYLDVKSLCTNLAFDNEYFSAKRLS